MSGDTDKAKISDNQDEDKKSATGDGQTTEDESSQDSKGELVKPVATEKKEAKGKADVDQQNSTSKEDIDKGDVKETKANGKDEEPQGEDSKDGSEKAEVKADVKEDVSEENGEVHDEADSKPNNKKPAPKKKPKKDDTEEEDEEDEEEEEEEEEGEEDDAKKDDKKETKVKKPAKKAKKDDEEGEEDEEEDEEEGEEEEEEEEEEEAPKPKPKKEPSEPPVPVPAGKGIPLGHIGNVETALSRFKTQDQKMLHQYLYGQLCLDRNVKRNIKKFKGYEWSIGSSDYKAKLEETSKMEPKQLRTMCEMLDLDKKGSSSELSSRLVGFLQQPSAQSPHTRTARPAAPAPPATGGRPRRSAALSRANRGYSDEEYESEPEAKVKGPKPIKSGSEDSDGSFNPSGSEEADSDFDPEGGEAAPGVKKRRVSRPSKGKRGRRPKGKAPKIAKKGRGRRAKSESEEESDKSEEDSDNESASENEESDEPKSSRGRPAKGRKPVAVKGKTTPAKRKVVTPPSKKKPAAKPTGRGAKKTRKASSEEDESAEPSDDDEPEASDDDDEPSDKKAKRPPTDDEIKKYVKHILEGANLEEITMKTVCKQVYSHYPDFDLAHKKDFIKATVKSLISS